MSSKRSKTSAASEAITSIVVRGTRGHNLKNVDIDLPRQSVDQIVDSVLALGEGTHAEMRRIF